MLAVDVFANSNKNIVTQIWIYDIIMDYQNKALYVFMQSMMSGVSS